MMKVCIRCDLEKPIEQFPVQTKRGKPATRGACRVCVNAQQRASYQRHRESRKERSRSAHAQNRDVRNAQSRQYHQAHKEERGRFYQANRERILELDWKRGIKRRYGITFEEYQQMLKGQGSKCAICGAEQPWTRSNRFAVDHDHATGKVRALLCHQCNRGIGNFKDDPDLLRKAAAFIELHRE